MLVLFRGLVPEEAPERRVFGCPRMKRGAPDLRVTRAAAAVCVCALRSRWRTNRHVYTQNTDKFKLFKGDIIGFVRCFKLLFRL